MSAAATAPAAAAPAKGKKKLIVIVAIAVLVLAAGGGAAMMLMKKKPAEGEEGDAEHAAAKPVAAAPKHDPKAIPVFVPLDPFTVNLADRDAERYAQVGVTLEIDDTKTGEQIKAYMPAIRNRILMAIADRNATDLLGREGKSRLAERIKRETSAALGFDVELEDDEAAADDDDDHAAKPGAAAAAKKKKKKKKPAAPLLPVRAVHFSNFIIQ